MSPIAPLTTSAPTASPVDTARLDADRAELRKAAEGFEAIMIRKMLESARASAFAEDTPLTGGGMKQFKQMRDEHFADIAASSGAFGFARSIEEQLSQHLEPHKG